MNRQKKFENQKPHINRKAEIERQKEAIRKQRKSAELNSYISLKGEIAEYLNPNETMNDLIMRATKMVANTKGIPFQNISMKTRLSGMAKFKEAKAIEKAKRSQKPITQ